MVGGHGKSLVFLLLTLLLEALHKVAEVMSHGIRRIIFMQ